jgi:hypothetical protein
MPPKKGSGRKKGADVPKLARGTASRTTRRSPVSDALCGLEELDEETLLTLSLDAPVQLSPSPGNSPLIPESAPVPLSNAQVSTELIEATLERLGFGPPNDMSNLPVPPSPTPANSEIISVETSVCDQSPSTAEESVSSSSVEVPDNDDSDEYDQIGGLFQQIARRTGHSVNSLVLEWALLHAHTDLVKRQVTHDHVSNAMTARQQAFEEEANKIIELVGDIFLVSLPWLLTMAFQGTGLADVGIEFMFVMVGPNATEDVSLGKVWSTPGLQGVCLSTFLLFSSFNCIQMFKELSLSDNEILAAARMHS